MPPPPLPTATSLSFFTTSELVKSLLVLSSLKVPGAAAASGSLLRASTRILGPRATGAALKMTFFGHFCAGENEAEVAGLVSRLSRSNVGAILDYAAEEDVSVAKASAILPASYEREAGEFSGAHFVYTDESDCDANTELFLNCIRTAHASSCQLPADASSRLPFVALKLTALCKPDVLSCVSDTLNGIKKVWTTHFDSALAVKTTEVNRETFGAFVRDIGVDATEGEITGFYEELTSGLAKNQRSLDYLEWTQHLSTEATQPIARRIFSVSAYNIGFLEHLSSAASVPVPLLTEHQLSLLDNFHERIRSIASLAQELGVRVLVDAEQSYLQPAIDHYTRVLQAEFNKGKSVTVYNTYQAYTKSCVPHVRNDIERARRLGFSFAAKLVRGAYLSTERKLAREQGRAAPVFDTIEETHQSYNTCLRDILDAIGDADPASPSAPELMVASHNAESVELTRALMADRNIAPGDTRISFGQLWGMSNHLSFPLGALGYNVYKYLPYGPVEETLPYLTRRAEENGEMLRGRGSPELGLIAKELAARLWHRKGGTSTATGAPSTR